MFSLTERDIAAAIMDGSAILILLGVMIYSSAFRKRGRAEDRLFFGMLIINTLMAVFDFLGSIHEEKTLPNAGVLATIGWEVFYILFIAFLITFLQYARARVGHLEVGIKSWLWPVFIPGYIYLILFLINPFTGWIFKYDENTRFLVGPLLVPQYIIFFTYLFVGFGYIAKYTKDRGLKPAVPVWLFMVPIVVGVAVAFIIPALASLSSISIAFSITFMYMGSLSEVVSVNKRGN